MADVLAEGDPESERLDTLAEELPYETVGTTLNEKLRVCDPGMDAVIARAMCSMMVKHYPAVARAPASGMVVTKPAGVMQAVRRATDLLKAWTNSQDEMVSFFAAKGLWGPPRASRRKPSASPAA